MLLENQVLANDSSVAIFLNNDFFNVIKTLAIAEDIQNVPSVEYINDPTLKTILENRFILAFWQLRDN